MSDELKTRIHEYMSEIKSPEDIFALFKILKYPDKIVFDSTSKRKKDTFDFKKDDEQKIKEIYSILSFGKDLNVFLLETASLNPTFIRSVATTFDNQFSQFLLIFSTDYSEIIFVFPNREKIETGKHRLKLTKLVLNKKEIHYTDIQILSDIFYEGENNWRNVWKKWKKAFSVERVTEAFFEDYKDAFFSLRKELDKQKISKKESHEFTLQFLNRIMFIYFISKKKYDNGEYWLGCSKFIGWLWDLYKKMGKYNSDEFYEKWLRQIFFKAFNNRSNEITDLPEEVVRVISNSPYLNGGLFNQNGLDSLKIKITDKMFQNVFEFFEKYNFTIKEDMPLDQEVAVDPQMIGYVYESLAYVGDEIYDRNDLGIFYTPRVEVDFMCRRSLVEYLSRQLPDIPKEEFYHLIFDLPEEKDKVEKWFDKNKLWYRLEEVLDNLSAVDPACGSGAFLVGLLNVVAEIYRTVYKYTKCGLTDFELKKRIIQYSLYGVDVMPWAIHAAELRLWLQLVVETEFKKEELRKNPLLPNLNLNLRIGDSLVQEIGGISFNVRTNNLKPFLKKKLEDLKQEKRKYFENSSTAKFKTPEDVRTEEIRLFEEIIEERVESLSNDIIILENGLKKRKQKQLGILGPTKVKTDGELKLEKERQEIEKEIKQNREEIEKLGKIKKLLEDPEKKPFVWDIDFAEIFGDKNGFDIVIGNPPYVRQEKISPPNKLKTEITLEDRREYKEELFRSVKNQFSVVKNIDKKSDYYIYFYFHGLGLLNEKGTFCFITSNSWLDVGYGKDLQGFLCKYVPITAIYDNPKRSFAHADVNTVISLFGSPKIQQRSLNDWLQGFSGGNEKTWPGIKNNAKFVMFKKPFEEVLNSKNLIEIENCKAKIKGEDITKLVSNVAKSNDYRVFPILQEDLLEDGWEYPENYKNGRFRGGKYEGNKWGGKYLRAPDIFYTILEKGKGKLIELNEIADLRFGIKTGVNDFFYFPNDYFNITTEKGGFFELIPKRANLPSDLKIEVDFLKPVITSPRECNNIFIEVKDIQHRMFVCDKSKTDLKNTEILKYILWGEKQKTKTGVLWKNVPSVSGRGNWYDIRSTEMPIIFYPMINNVRLIFCKNASIYTDANLVGIFQNKKHTFDPDELLCSLNGTYNMINLELLGIANLGEGAIKLNPTYIKGSIVLKPSKKLKFPVKLQKRKIHSIFEELGIDPSKPIREQEPKPLPDRAELDKIIFDDLGLTEEERKEVYWAVCEMVKQRLEKARSLRE